MLAWRAWVKSPKPVTKMDLQFDGVQQSAVGCDWVVIDARFGAGQWALGTQDPSAKCSPSAS